MYRIKPDYVIRPENCYSHEEGITDNYQNEVYQKALALTMSYGYRNVLDIGTGRGFKLVKYFKGYNTLGLDLPPTLEILHSTYPEWNWAYMPLEGPAPQGYELVLCSDMIEHLIDPEVLLDFIKRANPKHIVISTPDRDLMPSGHDGPPYNWCHVREWSFAEFGDYMREHFEVLEHYHSNWGQKTQCVVARLK